MVMSAKRVLFSCIRATTLFPAMSTSAQQSPQLSACDAGRNTYRLLQKWRQSPDSWLLRFALPEGRKHLGDDPTVPTCISVHHNGIDEASGEAKLLKKSYSPVSHPSVVGNFDLLVKGYTSRPGGGVGAAICATEPGETVTGKLKAERIVHGSPIIAGRWRHVGLVSGGTGVAPLVQIARVVLEDDSPDGSATTVSLLSINRQEEDVLMREELDRLAQDYPARFRVTYSLTGAVVPENWIGRTGRGDVGMARDALPPPAAGAGGADGNGTMIFVCGTDGFVETWTGPVGRAPPKADGSRGAKIQGPLFGILEEAGYVASEVFKY